MNTITAADFTVEFDITPEMYENFEEQWISEYKPQGYSKARAFKRELKKDIEREIKRSIDEKKAAAGGSYTPRDAVSPRGQKKKTKKKVDGEQNDDDDVRTIDIQFAFNNYKLINLLKKRGAAITALNFDKMRDYDKELEAMIHDKDNYDDITRPVCAFITFESDDHYNEACSFAKVKGFAKMKEAAAQAGGAAKKEKIQIEVLGNNDPEFIPATEPTNIIWENRHIKGIKFGLRACSAITIVIMMLLITFVAILFSKSKSIQFQALIPKRSKTFCPSLIESIGMTEAMDEAKENAKNDDFEK